MQTQYSVLSYRIDLYFHDYKLPVDENVYSDRNIHWNKMIKSNRARTRLWVY